MEGSCSTGQSPQWAVVSVEEEYWETKPGSRAWSFHYSDRFVVCLVMEIQNNSQH
jgi:hypothetical protein